MNANLTTHATAISKRRSTFGTADVKISKLITRLYLWTIRGRGQVISLRLKKSYCAETFIESVQKRRSKPVISFSQLKYTKIHIQLIAFHFAGAQQIIDIVFLTSRANDQHQKNVVDNGLNYPNL